MPTNNLTVTFTATSNVSMTLYPNSPYGRQQFKEDQQDLWWALQYNLNKKIKVERYWLQTWLKIKVALWEDKLGLPITIDYENDTNEQRILIIDSVHHQRLGSRKVPAPDQKILVQYDCRYLDREVVE
jgi:hypothetical protein